MQDFLHQQYGVHCPAQRISPKPEEAPAKMARSLCQHVAAKGRLHLLGAAYCNLVILVQVQEDS